jgi:hypothetical protein
MKRLGVLLVLAVVGVIGLQQLANATQNRPDDVRPGSESTVTFDVATRRYDRGDDAAAQALWIVCEGTISDQQVLEGPTPVAGGYQVVVTPSLGAHAEERLRGCLGDTTLDRILGHVESVQHTD